MNCQDFYGRGLQEDFIDAFAQAMNKNSYVNCTGQEGGRTYSCGAKASDFKTKEITEKAQECMDYLSSGHSTETMDKRFEVLKTLGQALETLAVRIKNSIEGKWWYPILNFFGYEAKAPKTVTTLLESVNISTDVVSDIIKKQDDPVPSIQNDWGYDVNIEDTKPVLKDLLTKFAYKEFAAFLDDDSSKAVEDFMKLARLPGDSKVLIRVRSKSNYRVEGSAQDTCLEQGCAFNQFSEDRPFRKVKELGFSAEFLRKIQRDPSFDNTKTGAMSEELKKDIQLIVEEMKKALEEG